MELDRHVLLRAADGDAERRGVVAGRGVGRDVDRDPEGLVLRRLTLSCAPKVVGSSGSGTCPLGIELGSEGLPIVT